jgi:hypothetical protein
MTIEEIIGHSILCQEVLRDNDEDVVDNWVNQLANSILKSLTLDQAELLDIIASFQEGHNTNIHCMELAKCISDNSDKIITQEE